MPVPLEKIACLMLPKLDYSHLNNPKAVLSKNQKMIEKINREQKENCVGFNQAIDAQGKRKIQLNKNKIKDLWIIKNKECPSDDWEDFGEFFINAICDDEAKIIEFVE